jgi:hypothetical protein
MNNLVHFALNVTLGKLYANMFIASLNHRLRNRRTANATEIDFESRGGGCESNMWAEHISHKSRSKFGALARFGSTGAGMNVHITTTKETNSYPVADTPATPLSALDHLNRFRDNRSDTEQETAVDHKAELVTEDGAFDGEREKTVLPRFTQMQY